MPVTSCKEAIKKWEQREGKSPAEATEVKLIATIPPIDKMDEMLNQFENCQKLSLSTNCIEKLITLPKLKNLRILSLGRNNIKRIGSLEEVGSTLEELWLSYNQIEKLDGLAPCVRLHTFFLSNNRVKSWDEVPKLAQLPEIKTVLLKRNPIYAEGKEEAATENILQVVKRIPQIETVDGKLVTGALKAQAEALD